MIVSAIATTGVAAACSHGWDSYDPRLGTASASGSGGGNTQSTTASVSVSSTTVTSSASSTASASSGSATSSGAGGAGGADAGPPTYRDIILAEGPLAYWRLGESQGPTIVDEVGQHPGKASVKGLTYGVPGLIAGNTAMSFDGTYGAIDVAGGWDFAGKAPYTFEMWLKLAPATNAYPRIISKESQTALRQGYLLIGGAPADGGSPSIGTERWENGNDLLAVYFHGALDASKWAHVVARFDGSNGAMFVNGVLANDYGTDPDSGLLPVVSSLTIGAEANNGSHFAGSIDELAIYGKALSDAVIASHHTAGLAGL
jgi:hypothetical protein